MTDDYEEEARALLEKNKERLRRLRKEFERAEKTGGPPPPGPIILGPKDELSYRRMLRDMDNEADENEDDEDE